MRLSDLITGATPASCHHDASKRLISSFDAPAFIRRGHEVALKTDALHACCITRRSANLAMIRMRLNEWSRAARPNDWQMVFADPIDELWPLAELDSPTYFGTSISIRKLRSAATYLARSVERFNRRWELVLLGLDLDSVNQAIQRYNENYVFEKECCLGSSRVASNRFTALPFVTMEKMLLSYPYLPVPKLLARRSREPWIPTKR